MTAALREQLVADGLLVPVERRRLFEPAWIHAQPCLTLAGAPRAVPRTTTAADLDAAEQAERMLQAENWFWRRSKR